MTVLTTPAQPGRGRGPRPVPWRRMAWVTWRQHRFAIAGVAAFLGVQALYLRPPARRDCHSTAPRS